MPPTLASLVQHPALKLVVRAGADRLGTPVRWAHASELADPVPYMDGGELLLVTATNLDAENADSMRRYVRRLEGAGVAGVGFAVGVNYEEVPAALVEAAEEAGLPLLEVPRRTPFLAISKAVSAAIAADQYRAVTAGFEAQRELTKAALAGDGPAGLLARLAAHVDGWAALYDASGAVLAAAPEWAARRAARLTPDVERLRDRPAPASVVVGGSDDRVELQSLGTGRRARGALAVGTGAALGTAERYAVNSAVALLTLTTARSRALHGAEQRLGAAVLRMLLAGRPDHARAVAGDLYGDLLDAPFRLLIAEAATPAGAEALTETMEAAAARTGEALLLVPEAERVLVLAADGGAAVAACAAYAAAQDDRAPREGGADDGDVVVGLSAPAGPIAVSAAYKQAEQALSVARRRGRALVEHEELATGSVLPLLADDAVRAFADGMLRALYEHDAKGRGDLVASLRAWLSRHGQWDAAAADLGVHRHTLRYRMRRVEEILGRSLDDPDVRMELWLALKATEAAAPAEG
ncbi:PucR family transcriptional regulator [Streptomyces sp. NPDC059698]|uniref:PucR family transcriptional regulator n=1 Tax=unclassified Streptomyces TaxID=2593676 RepID=UPI00093A88EF|nr:PucR family transcriptional regulator [Streptomyces sp. CB02366]OKJ32327.1 PucR family transcriptional regulator [Streptomyces sp. CB02366]TVP34126.1 PucR family transcriptional regulator [Streptomyces griseus subsp. griseus]WSS58032.1 PucR family transcriptional regulator [Streptomyces sp. NBC_01178]